MHCFQKATLETAERSSKKNNLFRAWLPPAGAAVYRAQFNSAMNPHHLHPTKIQQPGLDTAQTLIQVLQSSPAK